VKVAIAHGMGDSRIGGGYLHITLLILYLHITAHCPLLK